MKNFYFAVTVKENNKYKANGTYYFDEPLF